MDVNNIIISVMFVFAVCGGIDYIYSAEHDALHFFVMKKIKVNIVSQIDLILT